MLMMWPDQALLAVLVLHEHITPARALGLALIVTGDLLVGGASLVAEDFLAIARAAG